jgi:CelD/BcsL family acetyltransferase involved in cellulose biosynthesis
MDGESTDQLEVRATDSLEALAPWAERLDALNLASRRPTPFGSLGYVRTFLAHDEDAHAPYTPLFLVALEGGAPVGWVALRRVPGRLMGDRIEFLVVHDNDRPRLAARPEDEARCADAFLQHLLREPGWSLLELMEQDEGSPFVAAAARQATGFHVRRFQHNPNATIECRWKDGAEYFRSLSKNFRASMRSSVNRLFAEGRVEFVCSWEPAAVARLLDIHLEVEARSWKAPAAAGISRHAVRVRFFRALAEGQSPMRLSVRALLLDGVPIASELNGAFGDTWYSMEGTYDEAWREIGAGHLLFLMTMREALGRGVAAVNMLNNYAYVKKRYGATITETAALQVFRPWTPRWAKARLGELRRRALGRGTTQADVAYNLVKPRAPAVDEAGRPDRSASARAAAALLDACAGQVERLPGEALLRMIGHGAPAGAGRSSVPG